MMTINPVEAKTLRHMVTQIRRQPKKNNDHWLKFLKNAFAQADDREH